MIDKDFVKASVVLLYLWRREWASGKTSLPFNEWFGQLGHESDVWSNAEEAHNAIDSL